MSERDVDLFVIGAGSGGVRAARIAATHGARVAIAEEYRIGGTCVIRGCVPKKLLVYASRFPEAFEDSAGFGWTLPQEPTFSWPALIAAKDKEIARLSAIYEQNLARANVAIHRQRAVLDGPNAVTLADGTRITAERILIATGGKPVAPDFPGAEHAISSNEAFDLKALPERIAISGGGYIAVEFAGIFAGLGSKVTLIHRGSKLLRGFDEDVRDEVMAGLERRGVELVLSDHVERIDLEGDLRVVQTCAGQTLEVEQAMLAIGRRPLVSGLGLETVGVEFDHKGAIQVDATSQTTVPSIYAIGDVTDRLNLTPVAIREGHAFADTVYGGRSVTVDHSNVPTAVFATPEVGTVGLTEEQARERGEVDVYKARFRPMKATLSGRDDKVLMKLVVDAATDRMLGVHIVGEDAAEMIQIAAIAVKMGATKADFDATMALHPSAAEELVTLRTKWTGA
ncbi:glutathione-disulfide reductase [Chelatococcus sambhunathii]|uniref:Glutathione reductase n=1 Tax=Chelatococcus sambhunathii TaxID=363953 RepID=A0ABU1DBX4_9HYPH|nr:glutathione-disulfide reductase [Chelatococcus sambhunathii]MDR4305582.1 glutathione-disulfide reductase [Chelatococcus sambhunathii]